MDSPPQALFSAQPRPCSVSLRLDSWIIGIRNSRGLFLADSMLVLPRALRAYRKGSLTARLLVTVFPFSRRFCRGSSWALAGSWEERTSANARQKGEARAVRSRSTNWIRSPRASPTVTSSYSPTPATK
jgi:hypothetical protein